MKKTFCILFVPALILVSGTASPQWTSYHEFEGKCLDCHLTVPAENEPPEIFIKDISYMCEQCHRGMTGLSHPVNVAATSSIPRNFPLSRGAITCATCHYVHKQGYGKSHLRSRAKGEGFCVICHGDVEDESHQTVLGFAHTKDAADAEPAPPSQVVLDGLSLRCLQCHDAAYASDAVFESRMEMELRHRGNTIGQSHPVGVSYYEAKRKYLGAYRDVKELPPEIKLFDGTVGCGTCHNPYSRHHAELVMSNKGSALCLACHVK